MANSNGWGDGASNNDIGWGQGADNAIGWGSIYSVSSAGATDIVGTPAVDPDAQAFITAASITDPTQQSAINTLVTDLKGYSIWTKFKAIYPIVGGTAASHAVNLKTPGTFNLTFASGWSHSSTGMTPTNAYADSSLNLNTLYTASPFNVHYSMYVRTNTNVGIDMGVTDSASSYSKEGWFASRYNGYSHGGFYDNDIVGNGGAIKVASSDSRGFFVDSALSGTNQFLRQNTTTIGTWTGSNTSTPANTTIVLGGTKNATTGTVIAYSDKQYAFASIGDGLTLTEAANFYTAVNNFQVALSRNV